MTSVHPLDTPITRVLAQLKGVKAQGRDAWMATCPGHEDATASLSVGIGKDGRVLLNCHAGCTFNHVVAELGTEVRDLFTGSKPTNGVRPASDRRPDDRAALVKTYDYTDENGVLLYQSCRLEPKTFRQRRRKADGGWDYSLGDVRLVPYRLPEVIEAIAHGRTVYVVEGEKDVETLVAEGYAATTNPMGAGKWRDEYSVVLRGAEVVVLPDNDEPGRAHAEMVAGSLAAQGCTVRVVPLPGLSEKGDVSDWLAAGHSLDELETIVSKARLWVPDPSKRLMYRLDELLGDDAIMRPPFPVVPRLAWQGRSTLLAAEEKSGKSTLVGYMAAGVSRGLTFLGDPCVQGPVLIVGLEEFIGDAARRLRHFGADATRVYVCDKLPSDPETRLSTVRELIAQVRPVLVIIDSLITFGVGITDAASSAQMGPLVQGITNLAHHLDVAVVLVHHARRSDKRYRDSSAIGGGVDIIASWMIPDATRDTDPTLRRCAIVGRVPTHAFACRFDGDTYRLDEGASAPIDQRIIDYVRDHPTCSANDALDVLDIRRKEGLAAIARLLSGGQLTDSGDTKGRRLVVPASVAPSFLTKASYGRGN